MKRAKIKIHGAEIPPGTRLTLDLPVAKLYTHTPVAMPIHVIHGKRDGPRLFVSAAIHGDELNGVEIIRRLLRAPQLKRLRGMLIAIPIVNVHGLLAHSRYLPDRRDLNRSFPGTRKGSLAARLADLFMTEIVERCSHGIDLHTGAVHRTNLPHIRANLDDPATAALARVFDVPVLLNSTLRDGSLRQATAERGIPMLLYEGGEGLRFDEGAIRAGLRGILNVMTVLEMIPGTATQLHQPFIARTSSWVRAPGSGILRSRVKLGVALRRHERLGVVGDPFGESEQEIRASHDGILIGCNQLPLVNEGDALFHIARHRNAMQESDELAAAQSAESDAAL
jgi:predicted deacylase